MEVKLQEGFLLYVPDNPPKWNAEECECSHHPRCDRFLWGGQLMVRTMRGKRLHVLCAVRDGFSTQEELQGAFSDLLKLRTPPPKVPEKVLPVQEVAPPKPPQTKPKSKPGTRLPFASIPWSEMGGLEDTLANAPEHVRKKMLKKASR